MTAGTHGGILSFFKSGISPAPNLPSFDTIEAQLLLELFGINFRKGSVYNVWDPQRISRETIEKLDTSKDPTIISRMKDIGILYEIATPFPEAFEFCYPVHFDQLSARVVPESTLTLYDLEICRHYGCARTFTNCYDALERMWQMGPDEKR